MPTQPLYPVLMLAICGLLTACDANQSTTAQASSTNATSSVTQSRPSPVATTINSLDSVASVPVIGSPAPATMTMVTSVSSTVAVPVYITAGEHPDTHSIAEVGHIGHYAEAIAMTNTMLEGISQGIQASNPDVAFVRSMIAHHEGAIALAQIELKYGQDETLRKLAQDIILMRNNEIRWMMSWLDSHPKIANQFAHPDKPTELQQEPNYTEGLKEMYLQMLEGFGQENADLAFAQSMIPHHKGALAMAQIEFKYGNDDKIRSLADTIIVSQQGEITLLKSWIKNRSDSANQ